MMARIVVFLSNPAGSTRPVILAPFRCGTKSPVSRDTKKRIGAL